MGLVVQEPLMYEGSLWLFTWRGICLTLCKEATSAKSDKKKKGQHVPEPVTSGHQHPWQ